MTVSRNSRYLGLFGIAGNRTEDTVDDEVHEVDDHDDKTDFDLMQYNISFFCVVVRCICPDGELLCLCNCVCTYDKVHSTEN